MLLAAGCEIYGLDAYVSSAVYDAEAPKMMAVVRGVIAPEGRGDEVDDLGNVCGLAGARQYWILPLKKMHNQRASV